MVVFSSLAKALREGFRWYSFSRSERLHIVELDHGRGDRRIKALAFAIPTPEELAEQGVQTQQPDQVD